jgi:ketosteroid isomerase-like protein
METMRPSILAIAVALSALGIAACARTTTTETSSAAPAIVPASTENVEAVVEKLERQWVDAIVKKDVATLERLLADDFSGTSADAHSYTKTMAINELTSGKFVAAEMSLDEISVSQYGDVAVAFTSQQEKSTYDGRDTSGHTHFTDVWVKRDGGWQAVASHGTRYTSGH